MAEPPTSWTAIGALAISAFAFLRTVMTDRRTRSSASKTQAAARFEADFGGAIRDELRAFEKSLKTLKVFTLHSAKPVEDLQIELLDLQKEWEDASGAVEMLLREADAAPAVEVTDFAADFRNHASAAEFTLQNIASQNALDQAGLRTLAAEALAHYNTAIAGVRERLSTERARHAVIAPRSPFAWLKEWFRR